MGRPLGILVAFGLALSLAACGSDEAPERASGGDGASPTSDTSSFPVTVQGTNGEISIGDRPVRFDVSVTCAPQVALLPSSST